MQDVDGQIIVQAGRIERVEFSGQPAGKPRVFGALPPRAGAFQDRDVGRELTGTSIVSGLGGVGKTQLAAAHARARWEAGELDLMIWVNASSRASIVSAYAEAASVLTGGEDAESGARRLLAWLTETGKRWLVTLDDLQTPADLRDLWPPETSTGQVVVTTRRRDAALLSGRRFVPVDVFTSGEALAYLRAALAGHPHLLDDSAADLGAELGFLPIGLAQAAAYLIDRGLSCSAYRARLADERRTLAEVLPQPDELPDDHRQTVAAAWSLSIDLADRLAPAGVARPVLEIASLLDANGIPDSLFTSEPILLYVARRTGRTISEEDARDALHGLNRLSLITLTPSHRAVRVHALVQRATRESLATEDLAAAARSAADALVEIWPEVERDTELVDVLRTNATSLHAACGAGLWTTGGHYVLFHTGNSLGEAGLVTAAVTHFEHLREIATARLGPDHPDTLLARGNLARWRSETEGAHVAAADFELLLADYRRVRGPDHPDTLLTRSNLASCRGAQGDSAAAAAAEFEELLADRRRLLGPDHPDTLMTRSNLAYWQGVAGDPAAAAAGFEALLADRLRVLGPDHPDTLVARGSLARWRGEAGDAAGAVAACESLLADSVRVLGPEHPDTLDTRRSLARWRGMAGDPAGAVTALEQLLPDFVRVYGPDFWRTRVIRAQIDHWRDRCTE